jgi:hypothetical protein
METNFQILASKLDAIASSLQAINQTLIALQNLPQQTPVVGTDVTPPFTLFDQPKDDKEEFLSVVEMLAEFPDVFKREWEIYRLQRVNQIPHYRLGRRVRFKKSEIATWLKDKSSKDLKNLTFQGAQNENVTTFPQLTKIV